MLRECSLRTRKWQDKAGQDRYTTEIVAGEMQMLDSRGASLDVGGFEHDRQEPAEKIPSSPENVNLTDNISDDDIPF